ncbi:hypothetical protein [Rugosimonospora africana]|uniref:Toxin-antitoxin system, toxin component n=1 Tax=Rugosimonospora africana TaxID=556532 RepID=A0A8J3R3H9_9ACTN|nr:hypothetical protein [Rugosimonospora africana]GIH21217.1 hypothetical protein Raf01_93890 [Rugosimonospora africana]
MSAPQYQGQPAAYGPPTYPPQSYPQSAYPSAHAPAGYPAQAPAGYPGQAPAGYPTQAPAGYPAQAPAGYPAQAPAGYPTQAPAGYPAQPPAGYAPAPESPNAYPGQPPAGYPAPAVPGSGYQVPAQAYPQGTTQCRLCGCVPAVDTTFREHQGMIIVMRFLHLRGPFCRDCGLATFRRMTANTLIRGWYGYASSVITPITVIINLVRRGKVAKLPAPVPPQTGPSRQPMDPGAVLLARPQALIGIAIPVLVLLLIILLAA